MVRRGSREDKRRGWLAEGAELTYDVLVGSRKETGLSANVASEAIRVRRLREDAQRPISVNLAETIALSHMLMRISGAARRG
jgi:hypothetical protein